MLGIILITDLPSIVFRIIKKIYDGEVVYNRQEILKLFRYKLLSISRFLFSKKLQRELFEPIVCDWDEEYFEALFKEEIWKARWINVRYTYAFLAAMWMKSPVGDLIEFIQKFAK